MDVWQKLVGLLSSDSLASVEANNGDKIAQEFGLATYNEVLALPGYASAFTTLKELKRSVELIEARKDPVETEIRLSLRLLAHQVDKGTPVRQADGLPSTNVLALESFIRRGMWQRWTIEQQRSFDLRAEVITRWVDYFVSYTNRDAGQTNNQFRRLIKSAFGAFPPEPDRLNYNYVARVIAKYLDSNNLRGFTDAHNIKSGDEIEAKVFNYCKKAFTFTQVLERESFKAPPAPKRNWCYDEYQEFVSPRTELTAFQVANQTKVFTVIGAKTIDTLKPAVLGVFANWYDAIAGLKHISLEGMTNTELSSKIDEVAVLILERKRAIIDSLLAA